MCFPEESSLMHVLSPLALLLQQHSLLISPRSAHRFLVTTQSVQPGQRADSSDRQMPPLLFLPEGWRARAARYPRGCWCARAVVSLPCRSLTQHGHLRVTVKTHVRRHLGSYLHRRFTWLLAGDGLVSSQDRPLQDVPARTRANSLLRLSQQDCKCAQMWVCVGVLHEGTPMASWLKNNLAASETHLPTYNRDLWAWRGQNISGIYSEKYKMISYFKIWWSKIQT